MNVYHENQVPWPRTRPYCQARKNGPFKVSIATATKRVEDAVSMFTRAGKDYRTSELWIYIDGADVGARNRFLSNQKNASPAVAVRFDLDGHTYNIVADRYNTPEQNLAGIAAYIESVRAQERNGIFTVEEMLHTFATSPLASSTS